jgi:4-hydroxymandelate oxidase
MPAPHHVTRRQALTSIALAAGGATAAATARAQSSVAPPPGASRPPAAVPASVAAPPAAAAPDLFSIPQYEERARGLMSVPAWEYYDQGCADDVTVRWNREALQRLRLESRVMVDVERIDTSTSLFGRTLAHPILLAPAAAHMLVHPEGEVATARGAGAAAAIMVLSTNANCRVEAVAAAATQPLWFQLYVNRDRAIARDLIQRVESAGCAALCVTVDQPVIYARDRVSRHADALRALPLPNIPTPIAGGLTQTSASRTRSLTWKDLEWFRSVTKLPVVLKGVMHPDDAEQAVQAGADAIIVSNHGGRALDGVAATIDALPRVADRVARRMPVLMDGGIRRGGDVLKALARGADAVLIGRPYLYGLAVNGSDGVQHIVEILRREFETAMALTGRTTIAQIDRTVLWP